MSMHYQPNEHPTPENERGSVLAIVLVLMVGFAAFAQASLTKTVSEQKKVAKRLLARQVQAEADGRMEMARNMVNASSYTSGQNDALRAGVNAADETIPGTQVLVQWIDGTQYYSLTTEVTRGGVTKSSEAVVRAMSPASAFNLFVIDHPVGISGAPRGAIHTNRTVDFFFPGGSYRDAVTAHEGFNFVAGASEENTAFLGNVNNNAATSNLLDGVTVSNLSAEADALTVEDPFIAEVALDGSTVNIDLYEPERLEDVERTRTREVLTHYETETYTESEPVYQEVEYTYDHDVYNTVFYDEAYREPIYESYEEDLTRTVPVYEEREVEYTVDVPIMTEIEVPVSRRRRVWVSYDDVTFVGSDSSGGTVGANSDLDGFWREEIVTEIDIVQVQTGTRSETRRRRENVRTGERTETYTQRRSRITGYRDATRRRSRSEYSHTEERTGTRREIVRYEDVVKTRDVPVYETVEETYTETVRVDERFVRRETVDISEGTIYLGGDVRSISGQLNGRLSLIANGQVKITDSIQYVDDEGDKRMDNGLDPDEPYVENDDYDGDALLAIVAKDDIVYAKDGPSSLEVNASLMSIEGAVGFEGIRVSDDGLSVYTEYESSELANVVKDSLRRLGGIVSLHRPVATYLDETGWIGAGYSVGTSIMDQNLLLTSGNNAPPPFTFEAPFPTWVLRTSGAKLGAID